MPIFEKPRRPSAIEPRFQTSLDSEDPLLTETPQTIHNVRLETRKLRRSLLLWRTLSVLAILLAIFQFLFLTYVQTSGSFATGFDTDMPRTRPHISVSQRRFGSVLTRDDEGVWSVGYKADEPRYAGPPSREIDESWRQVLGAQYIPLSEGDIERLNRDPDHRPVQEVPAILLDYGDTQLNLTRGSYATIGVVHQLHCLNMLRKHIDYDYYGNEGGAGKGIKRAHLDHCVDTVRQAIMCWGDATPVPMVPWPESDGSQIVLADTERMRTCRNSKQLIEYTRSIGRVPTLEGELVN